MDDLIRRQDAIERIDAVFPVDPMRSEYAQGIASGAALAKTYVVQLPSAQQWIPCNERLPKEHTLVLVSDGEKIGIAYRREFLWYHESYLGDIEAWMPLPEPYREEAK